MTCRDKLFMRSFERYIRAYKYMVYMHDDNTLLGATQAHKTFDG